MHSTHVATTCMSSGRVNYNWRHANQISGIPNAINCESLYTYTCTETSRLSSNHKMCPCMCAYMCHRDIHANEIDHIIYIYTLRTRGSSYIHDTKRLLIHVHVATLQHTANTFNTHKYMYMLHVPDRTAWALPLVIQNTWTVLHTHLLLSDFQQVHMWFQYRCLSSLI